ncbi:MAG: hypothetical protein HKN68_22140 [Saprospiraceae bacterium]|nr:hypothetical protein [Saprospiraceae bacterium]
MIYIATYAPIPLEKSLFSFIFCFLMIGILPAQEKMDIQEWLETRKTNMTSSIQNMGDEEFSPSWIRELEFRTETEDFQIDKQEYLIRFRPTYPSERNAQSNLINASREEWDINQLNFNNDINRYLLDELLIIREINEEIEILTALLQVYEDQKRLISDQIYTGKFNLKDLSQVDGDIRSVKGKINDHQLRIEILNKKNILPDTDQLISIQDISEQLVQQDLTQQSTINRAERDFELRKVKAEMELEKIESGRIFDFIQLRYDGPHNDLFRERVSLGINLQLPNNGRQKLRTEELKVEQLIRQQEYDLQQKLDSIRLSQELNEFTLLIRKWNYNYDIINQQEGELNNIINKGINIEFDNPDIILYQKEQLLRLMQDQLDLESDIYQLYLDLLERTTILGENRFYTFILKT